MSLSHGYIQNQGSGLCWCDVCATLWILNDPLPLEDPTCYDICWARGPYSGSSSGWKGGSSPDWRSHSLNECEEGTGNLRQSGAGWGRDPVLTCISNLAWAVYVDLMSGRKIWYWPVCKAQQWIQDQGVGGLTQLHWCVCVCVCMCVCLPGVGTWILASGISA